MFCQDDWMRRYRWWKSNGRVGVHRLPLSFPFLSSPFLSVPFRSFPFPLHRHMQTPLGDRLTPPTLLTTRTAFTNPPLLCEADGTYTSSQNMLHVCVGPTPPRAAKKCTCRELNPGHTHGRPECEPLHYECNATARWQEHHIYRRATAGNRKGMHQPEIEPGSPA